MRRAIVIAAAVLLPGACASAPSEPPGPTAAEMAALVADAGAPPPVLRKVACGFIAEEGSEWRCAFEQRAEDGRWIRRETYVARDGAGWTRIDDVSPPLA